MTLTLAPFFRLHPTLSLWTGELFDLLQHLTWRPTWSPDQPAHLASASPPLWTSATNDAVDWHAVDGNVASETEREGRNGGEATCDDQICSTGEENQRVSVSRNLRAHESQGEKDLRSTAKSLLPRSSSLNCPTVFLSKHPGVKYSC